MRLRECSDLTHAVQVRGNSGGWRIIAAFDLDVIAMQYAKTCDEDGVPPGAPGHLSYRVVKITHRDF